MYNEIFGVGILGTGSCVPEKILTNFDLEKIVETSDEWITKRTGISERRILDEDVPAYTLGAKAAIEAIKDSGLTAEDIDLIIVTTCTPDYLTPSVACIIQKEIGAMNALAFDCNAACSGFIFGLEIAKQFIQNGTKKHVLVISCEALSKVTDWKDRGTCVLFGDASGAAVLGRVEKGSGLLAVNLGVDGTNGEVLTLPGCFISEADLEKRPNEKKNTVYMDGQAVFKFAVSIMDKATRKVVEDAEMKLEDIKYVFPHQANIRILEAAQKRLGLDSDKVVSNVKNYGNVSSATVPLALDQYCKAGKVQKGDNIVLVAFGGGLTWASTVIKWSK